LASTIITKRAADTLPLLLNTLVANCGSFSGVFFFFLLVFSYLQQDDHIRVWRLIFLLRKLDTQPSLQSEVANTIIISILHYYVNRLYLCSFISLSRFVRFSFFRMLGTSGIKNRKSLPCFTRVTNEVPLDNSSISRDSQRQRHPQWK